jgi:hypothetical protein
LEAPFFSSPPLSLLLFCLFCTFLFPSLIPLANRSRQCLETTSRSCAVSDHRTPLKYEKADNPSLT